MVRVHLLLQKLNTMKLKTFNPDVLPRMTGKQTMPRLSIHLKSGMFSFNEAACKLLNVDIGDQVQIYQDEESPENWYIAKVQEDGFGLGRKGSGSKGTYFCCTALARLILASAECEDIDKTSVNIPIAGEPTKLGKQTLYGLLVIALKRQS